MVKPVKVYTLGVMFASKNMLRIFVSGVLIIGFIGLFGLKSFNRFFEDGVTISKHEVVPKEISSPGKFDTTIKN